MEAGRIAHVPFGIMAVLVAGLALLVEVVGFEFGLGLYSLAFLAIPILVVVVYLVEYRKLPYVPPTPASPRPVAPGPGTVPVDATDAPDFVDPVEEADLLESGGAEVPGAEAAPSDAEPVR